MKTKYTIILGVGLALSVFTSTDVSGLSCGPSTLQTQYDYADHVFHGTLISKQHDPANPNQTTMVFDLQKSFKGADSEQVRAEFNEGYDKKFEQDTSMWSLHMETSSHSKWNCAAHHTMLFQQS